MASKDRPSGAAAAVELCARELRKAGDELYWKYKLLEILIKHYKTVANVK